jgi:hypothetical protein
MYLLTFLGSYNPIFTVAKANEALEQYMGMERFPPKKSVKKAEATTKVSKALKLVINKVFSYIPTYSWRKLDTHGKILLLNRSPMHPGLDGSLWGRTSQEVPAALGVIYAMHHIPSVDPVPQ